MNCKDCKGHIEPTPSPAPVDTTKIMIPFTVWETDKAREDYKDNKEKKRWFILVIILLVLFVASNIYWIIRDHSFIVEEIRFTAEQETDGGGNNYATYGDYYGSTEDDSN